MAGYRRVATLRTSSALTEHLATIGADLPFDDKMQIGAHAPLAQPYRLAGGDIVGNRFAVLPMEGWDGTADGRPSELTMRRWRRFGASGAKLIWGGEAVAVRHDGRANPNQLLINEANLGELAALRQGARGRARGAMVQHRLADRPAAHPFRPVCTAKRQDRWSRRSSTTIPGSTASSASQPTTH